MANPVIQDLIKIFKGSVLAVHPKNLMKRALNYNPVSDLAEIAGEKYNLQNKNLYLVGTGKAVQYMAREVENILDLKIKQGIISIPKGSVSYVSKNKNIHYCEGATNNLPDSEAELTAKKVENLIKKLSHDDILLVLISGGGSALLPLPKEPITLKEKTAFIKKLANSGADIKELNTVRKRISGLKGGKMAIKAQPAQVVSLILSDIVGDPLDLIASGPTVENKDHPSEAINVIKKYKLLDETSGSIKSVLKENVSIEVFPKHNVRNNIIGSNKLSIAAALEMAKNLNYQTAEVSDSITGCVKDVAREYTLLTRMVCNFMAKKLDVEELISRTKTLNLSGINLSNIHKFHDASLEEKSVCLIFGGETTVEVKGSGKGGRNQHLALEFSNNIHKIKSDITDFDVFFLSAGTDGIDGPTDAAGAVGYLDLVSDSVKEGLDIQNYIENNDSYNFYTKFKNGSLHVKTGHTNTNVMDIQLILIIGK